MQSHTRILILLFVGVFMGALDIAIIGPALPELGKQFALADLHLPWIFSAYVLANLISTPLMASMSDQGGRRNIYILCLLLFGLGSVCIILSESLMILLTGRVLQGLGAGGIFPLASAIIGDVFPREKQGSALGITGAVFGLAFLAGPPLGAWLLMYDWRWIFVLNIPLVMIMIPLAWRWLPGKIKGRGKPLNIRAFVLLGSGLLLLAYGLSHIMDNPWQAGAIIPGGILLYFWLRMNRIITNPVLDPQLLGNAQVRKVMLLAWGAGVGEVAVVFIPVLAGQRFNVSASEGGVMLIPLVLALAIGAPLAGRILDKTGPRPVLFAGIILLALGLAGIALNPGFSMVSFYGNSILIGLGLSTLLGAPLRYILNGITGIHNRAAGQALISISLGTGQLMASSIAGPLAESSGNFGLLLLSLACILLVLLIPVGYLSKS